MRHTGAVRIALVHYTCLPTIAGVELVMGEHARLFWENGHAVTVVAGNAPGPEDGCWESDPPLPAATPETLPISPPSTPPPVSIPLADLGTRSPLAQRAHRELASGGIGMVFEQAVEQLAAELRPILAAQDVVMLHNVATMHFHLALTAALWRLADELPRVRFVCWVHDLAACNPDYAPLPLHREPWARLAQAHPRFAYVAVSELRRRQFTELTKQPPPRCRTIPNGVDPTRLLDISPQTSELARRLGWLDRDLVLLHPTRLLRRKNVELTLRVVAALKAAGHSCACLITAPPEVQSGTAEIYEREIRDLHGQLDLAGDVFFLSDLSPGGPLGPRAMHEVFQLADALFFPSRQEGFGIPLLEAALHRLPIFCSDIEPLRTLLPRGVTTFTLEATPETIAALIVRTLAADPASAARAHTLRHFSWAAIYRNFLSPLLAETEPI